MPRDAPAHYYNLFGLSLRSSIALPELCPARADASPNVCIESGVMAGWSVDSATSHLEVVDGAVVLTVPQVARFTIIGGRRIIVDADCDAPAESVRLFLLGSAMGMLLHQRGVVPLHANAIVVDSGAIAFLGPSRAGKSTLAAAFLDRGHAILADDVCALAQRNGEYMVLPGVPRLKLWRDALENSGRQSSDYARVLGTADKFSVPTAKPASAEAAPLSALLILVRDDEVDLAINRLSGMEAFRAVVENIYRGSALEQIRDSSAWLGICSDLVDKIPIFELRRGWDAKKIDASVATIAAVLADRLSSRVVC
ncbi:MAG: hypothetical protein EON59_02385 [Alphaproteobacteria bacterium]|nr:MAG: hypothetical protein EON59_02385 [Alphaproteobacteria bacterium]